MTCIDMYEKETNSLADVKILTETGRNTHMGYRMAMAKNL